MEQNKLDFLVEKLPELLIQLDADARGKWGVMNGQQMVEHFIEVVLVAAGKIPLQLFTPADRLPKMREFLFSDAPFRENTKNPLMQDQPAPTRLPDMPTAISELKRATQSFQLAFQNDPQKEIINPFFGPLNFDQQVHFLHKHAIHHLRQFGLI
ncbi:DinB family protein [Flavihumibacter fluvii]|uniref:DinB family protein n=1 Tax=Flavihumibacter fluvii TaxID=2838157 RepID=UPI001BDE870B|nr:DinB family protein [Flavihumibacter fluvii]ULQ51866.1 hypothetical protein KJS93_17395 [Flavihumibacter fluvii]